MNNSAAQINANKNNAQKSTGPVTEAGKQNVANNALKHGLFSKQLILKTESDAEYQLLLDGLRCELKPVGTLEQSLVERISVSLWRQRRLVSAETAQINLNQKDSRLINMINNELNFNRTGNEIKTEDLIEYDQKQLIKYKAIAEEYYQLDDEMELNSLEKIEKHTPLIYQQLTEEAVIEEVSVGEYIKFFESLREWVEDLINFYHSEIKIARQRPLILEVANLVQNKESILQGRLRDSLAKYQVMLDNELYKAIKALREVQAWRFETLESITEENGFVLENKA